MLLVEHVFRRGLAQFQQPQVTAFNVIKNVGNFERRCIAGAGLTAWAIGRKPVVTTGWNSAKNFTTKFGRDAKMAENPLRRFTC